ncbi:MAG: hypothetical protein E7532_07105 [Ruminococcaceae bacterium]|nr:hypothetical protein [Oscillospiraceae bacterium]
MKKVICSLLIILVLFSLTACPSPFYLNNHPAKQKNTTWVSEEHKIKFYVGEREYPIYGTIQTDDGEKEILVSISTISNVFSIRSLYADEQGNYFDYVGIGSIDTKKSNNFVVVVTASDYFAEGEKITFNKIESDNNEDSSMRQSSDGYYTMDDFRLVVIGKSTFNDVFLLAPDRLMQDTSYGGFCDYPMKNGGIIRIKFEGKDLVVSEIEEISPEDVTDIIY